MRKALIRSARQALLFLVLPALATGLTLTFLVPPVAAAWLREQPLPLAAAVFLAFVLLVANWTPRASSPPGRARTMLLVAVAALAGIGASQLFRPASVLSTSMVPTLLPGDRLWVDRFAGAPRRGDVVVFRHAEGELVKRVIGLPGDVIELRDGQTLLNGAPLPSCDAGGFVYLASGRTARGRLVVEWLDGGAYLTVQQRESFAAHTVPPGQLFVLGDNRGLSNDSRRWAGLPAEAVDGRVEGVLFAADRRGGVDLARLGLRLGTDVELPGVDLAPLREGVGRCLARQAGRDIAAL